ncbi:Methyltransferase domain-containing protein [Georgenia satyanarayanai]|uniref:Methyltransferase domain-containing protein n=1 Tax=Georgenia satyanarayanai TaxID=860221 RepID=A0A2Y9A6D8_9MICO|nr:class I SAM-dependent methyltransferase [Georgenia satyanarayanai]PYG00625.1 methyltransferase family protein [Georgenia satyanarayanai]SSA40014.1 Methyltransferase domain-containing protein [Georgenia satyanarayanai]
MTEQSKWVQITQANPDHSTWYVERFRQMAASGADVVGEARLIDAMVPRAARILDAGCGPGRHGGYLAAQGHTVVGVDVDPVLIAAAKEDFPDATWLVEDLAELDLPARGIVEPFDAILCAGNVMTFLATSTRREVLRRMARHLTHDGRAVIGFGAGRGYDFDDFLGDARAAGLVADHLLSTWDLRPAAEDSDFLVAVLRRD